MIVFRIRAVAALVAGSAFLLCGGLAGSAFAANPVPFSTSSGSCGPRSSTIESTTQPSGRSSVLARISTLGSLGSISGGEGSLFLSGDTVWLTLNAVPAGGRAHATIFCDSVGSWSTEFSEVPTTPTAFSGRTTGAGWQPYAYMQSQVAFRPPAKTNYLADLTISGGAVRIDGVTYASSQTIDLGMSQGAIRPVGLTALNGPPVDWTISIRGAPVVVSSVTSSRAFIRAGTPVEFSYALSGETDVSAEVSGSNGTSRTLATALRQQPGTSSLTWDGRSVAGSAFPDGTYAFGINSADAHGGTSSGSVNVGIDATSPSVISNTPEIGQNEYLSVEVADAGSGVGAAYAQYQPSGDAPAEGESLGYGYAQLKTPGIALFRPYTGWKTGTQTVRVVADDAVGNRRVKDLRVRVVSSSCSSARVREGQSRRSMQAVWTKYKRSSSKRRAIAKRSYTAAASRYKSARAQRIRAC